VGKAPGKFIHAELSIADEVTVTGPHGNFLLNENSGRTQLYIAHGLGFAPVKSLIEHAMAIDENSSMHLYRVVDRKADLYLDNLCRSWNDALDDFHYHTAVETDFQQAFKESRINMDECDVYVAGGEAQVSKTKTWLLANGLPEDQLFTNSLA
jgi:CDP-4-dehydro-6-deoxyglucose reductase